MTKSKFKTGLSRQGIRNELFLFSEALSIYRNSSLPCNKSQMERDFRVVKIEAELILEANRLQLMKQDLEKAECLLEQFHLKKSKTLLRHGCSSWRSKWQE
ncbi:hypothetical protein TNCV_1882741 [Trichonephila clavipes]|nr:hypothetical protein TNCV_1882741 [Trichonephila clavipes]